MRIAVFGAGGIGGYLGGRLAQAGEDVSVIARGGHLAAIRENGLKVDSVDGDFVFKPSIATDDPGEVGPVDVVILGVKAWQVTEAAEAMRPMVGPETCVLPLQNGVEATGQLSAVLGDGVALGGISGISGFIVGPGHIRNDASGPFLRFGEMNNQLSPRVERLSQAINRTGIKAEIPSNIESDIWWKLMFICASAGVGTVTRTPTGVWRSLPETWQMAVQIVREVESVAIAKGIDLAGNEAEAAISLLEKRPPNATSSLSIDIMGGRPSELEAQIGVVVHLGKETGVPTPVSGFIYHCLLPLEMKARGQLEFPV